MQKMFSKIHTLVEDSNALICILIDEVWNLLSLSLSLSQSLAPIINVIR